MTLAVSLDIETLSTHKDAVILSIGACTVSLDGSSERTFSVNLDVQSQIDAGRHVSADTLKWWMAKEGQAQLDAFIGEDVPPAVAIEMLRGWLKSEGYPPVYTKGPAFDGAIIESLAESFGVEPPIPYRKHRDLRTLEDVLATLCEFDEPRERRLCALKDRAYHNITVHNALADAIAQGEFVRFWLNEFVFAKGDP